MQQGTPPVTGLPGRAVSIGLPVAGSTLAAVAFQIGSMTLQFNQQVPGNVRSLALGPDEKLTAEQIASRGQAHSALTSPWIARRVAERDVAARAASNGVVGYGYRDYRVAYDAKANDVSKALVILHVPVAALARALGTLAGKRVAVLGLTFKPHTDDVRESPAAEIIANLVEGGALVRAYDPLAAESTLPQGAERTKDVWSALDGCEAAVLVTEWPEFVELDWKRAASLMKEPRVLFDGRNALPATELRAAGFDYMAVGRDGTHRSTGR